MKNLIPRIINYYARSVGTFFSLVLPIGVIVGISTLKFDPSLFPNLFNWVGILWLALLGNSLILLLNGLLVILHFTWEIRKLVRNGIPIRSSKGFRHLETRYKSGNIYLIFIFILSLFSYGFFYSAILGIEQLSEYVFFPEVETLLSLSLYLAVSMLIFVMAATIVIRVPPLLAMNEGKLFAYYEALRHPNVLNSYFYDSLYNLLDPVSRVELFKWCSAIRKSVVDDFAPNLQPRSDRAHLAVQNVLVFMYIHFRFPNIVDLPTLEKELKRIVTEDQVQAIIASKILNPKRWKMIFKNIEKNRLEHFLIIDRIILTLRETPEVIQQNKYWITSSVSPSQNLDETKDILFFLLNLDPSQTVPPEMTMDFKGGFNLSPGDFSFNFYLRPYSEYITSAMPKDKQELTKDNYRLLFKLLMAILYQGTGIWLTIHSSQEGSNIGSIIFNKGLQTIDSSTFDWQVTKDIRYYAQSWGPKILSAFGFLLPLIRAFIGF